MRGGLPYWQCGACPHQTSLISGTIFEASKLPLRRWFLAMQLLTQSKHNVSALELKRQLGVSYRSAWLLKHKIMQAMRLAEDGREFDGRIEIDDAYLGGEFSGGKPGRGAENKVPFVAAVQTTADGRPLYACLSQQPPTNEAMAGRRARTHRHRRWQGQHGTAQFKWVNTLLSNLKTAITGTYHAFDFAKYAHRYLAHQRGRDEAPQPVGDQGGRWGDVTGGKGRVPVPFQPPLQHEDHPVSLALRPRRRTPVLRATSAGC